MPSQAQPSPTPLQIFNLTAPNYEVSTAGCTRELARYAISLLPDISPSSHILDNACGNGIVGQELIYRAQHADSEVPKITSVDGAENMVALAKTSLSGLVSGDVGKLEFDVMSGEKLEFGDGAFTHSITNLGILFFSDGAAGVREIYRTLEPGGVAVVTTWGELGYIETIQAAQKVAVPDSPSFRVPVSDVWFDTEHLADLMKEVGFEVEVSRKQVHYAGRTVKDVVKSLGILCGALKRILSGEELEKFEKELEKAVERDVVSFERVIVGGKDGEVEKLVGLETGAIVVVGKKK